MIIQESLLVSIFFAALLSLIVADRIVKARKDKMPLSINNRNNTELQLQVASKNGKKNEIKSIITANDF